MKFVVGVDTGGTFTDLICVDENGDHIIEKIPSTPKDPSIAIVNGLKNIAQQKGLDLRKFLGCVIRICHGTTVTTNTVLTWTGAKVGLVYTKGFRDILGIRFGVRENPYNYTIPAPKPLAPRYLRRPALERIKWNGEVITPLNKQDIIDAATYFKEQNVEAVVVSFIWSFRNRSHEKQAIEILKEYLPGVYICGSCDIQPELREYWRTSTAILNAYVGPNLSNYLNNLMEMLNSSGFGGQLLITQSNAGVIFPEIAIEQAVRTLLSGPACSPSAAAYLASPLNLDNLITIDMGGTSLDVCLIKDGKPYTAIQTAVGGIYHLRLPLVDVHTIGAGGGSIAWLDDMNVLHVGPQSAGADPGPACYGKGNSRPTSTDADLVLGYLNHEFFLGGDMQIDLELAKEAIKEHIADPLGISVIEAAKAIRKIIDHEMSDAISQVSVERGEDPRKYILVAAGGAGPVHAASLAKPIGIKQVLISRASSIFCALGSTIADLRHDFVSSILTKTATISVDHINLEFDRMKNLGDAYLEREGIHKESRYYKKSIDMRYKGQFHEVEIPLAQNDLTKDDVEKIVDAFHQRHEELYAFQDVVETEMINLRLSAFGKVVVPTRNKMNQNDERVENVLVGQRDVFFVEESGFVSTSIYNGDLMQVGMTVEGPAIIEQRTTTIAIPPKAKMEVTKYGDYLITLE